MILNKKYYAESSNSAFNKMYNPEIYTDNKKVSNRNI